MPEGAESRPALNLVNLLPRPTHTPAWAVGMRKLGPGIYVDGEEVIHIGEEELCEYFNVPYNATNSRIIQEAARESIALVFGCQPMVTSHPAEEPSASEP